MAFLNACDAIDQPEH